MSKLTAAAAIEAADLVDAFGERAPAAATLTLMVAKNAGDRSLVDHWSTVHAIVERLPLLP